MLLFGVMKSQKQNTELPLNANEQRVKSFCEAKLADSFNAIEQESPAVDTMKKRGKNLSFLFGTKILSSDKYPNLQTSF